MTRLMGLIPRDKSWWPECFPADTAWHSLAQTNPTGSEPVWHSPACGVPQSAKEMPGLKMTVTAIMQSLYVHFHCFPLPKMYLQRKSESSVMTIEKRAQNHIWPSNFQFLQSLSHAHIKIHLNFFHQYLPEEWCTLSTRTIPSQHHFNDAAMEWFWYLRYIIVP